MQENIGGVKLDYSLYQGEDLYSDGIVEDDILDIVANQKPEEYNRIIQERGSWPILYHLSKVRANIIEWLPITKNDTILEIGAGCGAITGTLAAKGKNVTAIELSKKRSLINAHRNKNKGNICIKVGNYQDIEERLEEKYDYVLAIGVLEYAASYIADSQEPYVEFLSRMKRKLSVNGKLVIAIENKFGLKYWAGCAEDHTGKYFESIEGYEPGSGVATFSKQELNSMFQKVGFTNAEFYYPYPDYKFPNRIYSDMHLPTIGELNENNRNYDRERILLFNETKVFDQIIKNNLFDIYSNSYLVVLTG